MASIFLSFRQLDKLLFVGEVRVESDFDRPVRSALGVSTGASIRIYHCRLLRLKEFSRRRFCADITIQATRLLVATHQMSFEVGPYNLTVLLA